MKKNDAILKTERLLLKPTVEQDAERLYPFVSDPDISRLMSWDPHDNIDQTTAFCRSLEEQFKNETAINWTIYLDGYVCGLFGLIDIKRNHRSIIYDKGELAYWCGKPYQGRGIMKEAGNAVVEFAFENMNLNKLTVAHYVENKASKGLIQSLGFSFHYPERRAFKKHGRWIDCYYYELFNPNYINTNP